jgi:hypothetical protein
MIRLAANIKLSRKRLLGTNAPAYFVGVSGAKKTEWHYQVNYGEAKYFYVSVNEQQTGGFGLGQVTIKKN